MIRIRLISVAVDDQDKAERFYIDALGFRVKRNVSMGPVRAAVLDDACGNLIMLYSETAATAA